MKKTLKCTKKEEVVSFNNCHFLWGTFLSSYIKLVALHSADNLKAWFNMNRREIWRSFKRELLGFKWVGNTNRQLASQVCRGLFRHHLLIRFFTSNLNFSNPSNLQHLANVSYGSDCITIISKPASIKATSLNFVSLRQAHFTFWFAFFQEIEPCEY